MYVQNVFLADGFDTWQSNNKQVDTYKYCQRHKFIFIHIKIK